MQLFAYPTTNPLRRRARKGVLGASAFALCLALAPPAAAGQIENLVPAAYSFDHSLALLGITYGIDPALPVFQAQGSVVDGGFNWAMSGTYLGQPLSLNATGVFDPVANALSWTGGGSYDGKAWAMDGVTNWLSPTDFAIKDSISIGGTPAMISGIGATPDFNFGTLNNVGGAELIEMVDKHKFLFITLSTWTSGWTLVVTQPDGTIQTNVYTLVEDGSKVGVSVEGGKPGGTLELGGSKFVKNGGIKPVPEPATWATMIVGFGLVGLMMRRRERASASVQAVS